MSLDGLSYGRLVEAWRRDEPGAALSVTEYYARVERVTPDQDPEHPALGGPAGFQALRRVAAEALRLMREDQELMASDGIVPELRHQSEPVRDQYWRDALAIVEAIAPSPQDPDEPLDALPLLSSQGHHPVGQLERGPGEHVTRGALRR